LGAEGEFIWIVGVAFFRSNPHPEAVL